MSIKDKRNGGVLRKASTETKSTGLKKDKKISKEKHQDRRRAKKNTKSLLHEKDEASKAAVGGLTKSKNTKLEIQIFEEGKVMTQFGGYWVLRSAVDKLKQEIDKISLCKDLDPVAKRRAAKKLKRAQNRYLLRYLATRAPSSGSSTIAPDCQPDCAAEDNNHDVTGSTTDQRCSPNSLQESDEVIAPTDDPQDNSQDDADSDQEDQTRRSASENNMAERYLALAHGPAVKRNTERVRPPRAERRVKFDGVWMTAEAVGRLKALRQQLRQRRLDISSQRAVMKSARRREETRQKRRMKRRCLCCREAGHDVSECPKQQQHEGEATTEHQHQLVVGICFRCGSTEHVLSACRSAGDALPFATCFVCGKSGHLSRDCTLNAKGAYPRGGSCRICGQRSHLAKECPEKNKSSTAAEAVRSKTTEEPCLKLMGSGGVEDDYEQDFKMSSPGSTREVSEPVAVRSARTVRF